MLCIIIIIYSYSQSVTLLYEGMMCKQNFFLEEKKQPLTHNCQKPARVKAGGISETRLSKTPTVQRNNLTRVNGASGVGCGFRDGGWGGCSAADVPYALG